ncbi:MAG: hypothetical protein GY746_12895 [Gammaproteobacteria bacterium]|nr:hypothetical protein [Gammaproteobacteria bacterium]MCP4275275.1 hypothetical protein [Gammaproteobacteria bacterium]
MTNQTEITPETADNNNLEGLTELASIVAAAQDAMTDDMVSRLAGAFSEGITLLDRLTRNEGLLHLLQEIDRPENQQFLISVSNAFTEASRELPSAPPAKGGLVGLIQLASQPGVQEGLKLVSLICKHLSRDLRQLHRRGL